MRTFTGATSCVDNCLNLALAPGLGIDGFSDSLSFFKGFTTQPQVVARSLVALSDITATRYYNYTPERERDPILSAHGDRLRAECFSACNGVYACFELMGSALDGGDIGFGTTNVDINSDSRVFLSKVSSQSLLHLNVGRDGLRASTRTQSLSERPVVMPQRWVPALGNIAQILTGFTEAFRVNAAGAKVFLATLPPASATTRSAWLSCTGNSVRVAARPVPGSVTVPGIHRLSALKRLLPHAQGLTVFMPDDSTVGALVSLELSGARITLALTDEAWRGFSGEGSLLVGLAEESGRQDAELVSTVLAFDPVIDTDVLIEDTGLTPDRLDSALALLAGSGRVGWDPHARAYYHRELPDDHDKVIRANPRLGAAQKLKESGMIRSHGSDWVVSSGKREYVVRLGSVLGHLEQGASCSCRWHFAHEGNRGPCKHILAVILKVGEMQ